MAIDKNTVFLIAAAAAIGGISYYSLSGGGDDDCSDSEDEYETHNSYENYCNSGNSTTSQQPPQIKDENQPIISADGYAPPAFKDEEEQFEPEPEPTPNATPLNFSEMAGGIQEDYHGSEYELIKNYNTGSESIPIYNESDGNIGLPVPDMTDISAGENNKYVYDRTIGTIGFTSTKIGGRRRGQADYIRGDLPIIPDENSNFQVSADPLNTLMLGAMNQSNGIGSNMADAIDAGWEIDDSVPYTKAGPQMAMNPAQVRAAKKKAEELEKARKLVAEADKKAQEKKGGLTALKQQGGGGQQAKSVQDIFKAVQAKNRNKTK